MLVFEEVDRLLWSWSNSDDGRLNADELVGPETGRGVG